MLHIDTYRSLKRSVPIKESHEPMIDLPDSFLRFTPHPYLCKGADYGEYSPYMLRKGVVERLLNAQKSLDALHPGWHLKIFDAYRPLRVQRYMIAYECNRIAQERYAREFKSLTSALQQEILAFVETFWSPITDDTLRNPPPHATGGAVDLSIVDADGNALAMGTQIDELCEASHASYYALNNTADAQQFHANRELLRNVMEAQGFVQLPTEWWHFSYGDQLWALSQREEHGEQIDAIYGITEQ